MTTDRFIVGSQSSSPEFGVQGEKSRVNAVPLAWSAALRVRHNIVLQASIEYVLLSWCPSSFKLCFLRRVGRSGERSSP